MPKGYTDKEWVDYQALLLKRSFCEHLQTTEGPPEDGFGDAPIYCVDCGEKVGHVNSWGVRVMYKKDK